MKNKIINIFILAMIFCCCFLLAKSNNLVSATEIQNYSIVTGYSSNEYKINNLCIDFRMIENNIDGDLDINITKNKIDDLTTKLKEIDEQINIDIYSIKIQKQPFTDNKVCCFINGKMSTGNIQKFEEFNNIFRQENIKIKTYYNVDNIENLTNDNLENAKNDAINNQPKNSTMVGYNQYNKYTKLDLNTIKIESFVTIKYQINQENNQGIDQNGDVELDKESGKIIENSPSKTTSSQGRFFEESKKTFA